MKKSIKDIEAVAMLKQTVQKGNAYFLFLEDSENTKIEIVSGGKDEETTDGMIVFAFVNNPFIYNRFLNLLKIAGRMRIEDEIRQEIQQELN